jgi:fructose-bisphosphate aldolase class II
MLVNATSMLRAAKAHHYAVGQFNINNLEWTKSVLLTAQKLNSPVILGVSCGAGKYMCGFSVVADMVRAMDKALGITVPVALHLDHGTYDAAKKCVECGFTSIMFDGSSLPLDENFAKTRELVNLAHNHGLSIEAEVGSIGGTEDGVTADGEVADPEICKKMVSQGIDFLAAGIGNIHGIYPKNWKGLHFDVLETINKATGNIPLVLHGGTGIPDDMIVHAIHDGVSKININTDCQLVFAQATIDYVKGGFAEPTADNKTKGYDPRKLLKPGCDAIANKVEEKMKLFESIGKGEDYLNF